MGNSDRRTQRKERTNMNIWFSPRPRWYRGLVSVLVAGLVAALALAGCGSKTESDAGGQGGGGNPTKDIDWIVPDSPGGGLDIYSPGIAEGMQRTQLPKGVYVGIRNRPPLPQGITQQYTARPAGHTV